MQFATNQEAFQHAKHRARYAHHESIVFQREGQWFAERRSKAAIKAALLASGTKGRFHLIGCGAPMIVGWRIGTLMFRNEQHHAAAI